MSAPNKGAGRGNPYLGGTLGEASAAASRTRNFLGAKYRRLIRHIPKGKAQRAVMRHQLVITWHIPVQPRRRRQARVSLPSYTGFCHRRASMRPGVVRELERVERILVEPSKKSDLHFGDLGADECEPGAELAQEPGEVVGEGLGQVAFPDRVGGEEVRMNGSLTIWRIASRSGSGIAWSKVVSAGWVRS
jgi:hypothetical protein